MSYDVWMEIDTGGSEPVTVVESINYTSNVSSMWQRALGDPLSYFDGFTGGECLPIFRQAIVLMEDNPEEYKEMNPKNGWGDYEGALQYLRNIQRMCVNNPKGILSMCY